MTRCPPCAVKSAACRGPTENPYVASASLKPRLRSWVSGRLSMPAISPMIGFADVALLELGADVVAGAHAHAVVVAADPRPVGQRGVEDPVEVDHRDAGLHGLGALRRQLAAVVGQDHQRVDLLVDQGVDRGDLLGDVVGRVHRRERHVRVLRGLGLGVRRDGGDPAVVGRGRGEADRDRAGPARRSPRRPMPAFGAGAAAGGGVLLVHAASAAPAPTARAPERKPRRPRERTGSGRSGIVALLVLGGEADRGGVRCPRGGRGSGTARRRR